MVPPIIAEFCMPLGEARQVLKVFHGQWAGKESVLALEK
jgi:hypothetical protein